jgi:hypothetical protein
MVRLTEQGRSAFQAYRHDMQRLLEPDPRGADEP